LPVPADAIIRFCESVEVAAAYCSGFRLDNGIKTPY